MSNTIDNIKQLVVGKTNERANVFIDLVLEDKTYEELLDILGIQNPTREELINQIREQCLQPEAPAKANLVETKPSKAPAKTKLADEMSDTKTTPQLLVDRRGIDYATVLNNTSENISSDLVSQYVINKRSKSSRKIRGDSNNDLETKSYYKQTNHKTATCENFFAGCCKYGDRCNFKHELDSEGQPIGWHAYDGFLTAGKKSIWSYLSLGDGKFEYYRQNSNGRYTELSKEDYEYEISKGK